MAKEELPKEVEALLNIIKEKDNLIISLKESATRRDKLNERQIKLLSEDNARKLAQINKLQSRIQELESKVKEKESEVEFLKTSGDKVWGKIEEFKVAIERYKTSVKEALNEIKFAIQEEITRREEHKNKMLDELKERYMRLERQLEELDNYYKGILEEVAQKQGLAKNFIKHALHDLQEALALLDMGKLETYEPVKLREDFSRLLQESYSLLENFRKEKALPGASTIVEKIENVNIKLESTPVIEGILGEIMGFSSEAGKKKGTKVSGKVGAGGGAPILSGTGSGGGGIKSGSAVRMKSGGSGGEKAEKAESKKKIPYSPEGGGAAGIGSGGGAGGGEGFIRTGGGAGAGVNRSTGSGINNVPPQSQPSGIGSLSPEERVKGHIEEPEKKRFGEDVHEVIFKRGRNYAPFNWKAILTDINLARFQPFIESCIKAEREGNLMKALQLYKTIREQPGIQGTIAAKLLDDHIEYLEDMVKRKYTLLPI